MADRLETGAKAGEAKLAAVMLHGRGRLAEEMADLGEALGVAGIRYFAPRAPDNSWYPGRFLEPLENNQPALGRSLEIVEALIEELHRLGFADERIALCGFSQGGCLAAQMLLRRPAPYAAALLLTGGLIGPPGKTWVATGRLDHIPVLLTGSEIDEWVPAWRTRETEAVLSGLGAQVETVIYRDRGHIVSGDEIARAAALLERCVPTARRDSSVAG